MPTEKRFVVDSMLGKVAKWLRALGFETRYQHLKVLQQLEEYAQQDYHIVTRNTRWVRHPATVWVTANDPREQLREIVAALSITPAEIHLLCRCLRCNELLQEADRALVAGHVPDYIYQNRLVFRRCPRCYQIYWAGSHLSRMHDWLHATLGWRFSLDFQGGSP
jgi:uncharacterized protein